MSTDSIDIELKLLDLKRKTVSIKRFENLKKTAVNNFFGSKLLLNNYNLEIPKGNLKINSASFYIKEYLRTHNLLEKKRLLPIKKNIEKTKKSMLYEGNLSLGIGFNNSSDFFNNVFQNPNQSQNLAISLNIPIIDFGKRKTELEITKLEYEIEIINLEQEKSHTNDNIFILHGEIVSLIENLKIQEARINLLKKKLKTMKDLLFTRKILFKDYSETENILYVAKNEKIELIQKIYLNIVELEKITLVKIL